METIFVRLLKFHIKMKEESLFFRDFFQSLDKFLEKGRGYGNFCGNSDSDDVDKID